MYFFVRPVLFLPIFLLLLTCNSNKGKDTAKEKIRVAAAANVQFALKAIEVAFEKSTNIEVDIVIASSGKLNAQIKQGAPYDVFIAANLKYPQDLYTAGFATTPPKIYALGKLVLWTMNEKVSLSPNLSTLEQEQIKHIGIANPKNAPYGAQAIKAINFYNLQENIKHKLVYGENIAQVNQYVLSQHCQIGITAKSVVVAPKLLRKGKWEEIDPNAYEPITQGAVITKYGQTHHNNAAATFFSFLSSQQAQQIFLDYGYIIPQPKGLQLDSTITNATLTHE